MGILKRHQTKPIRQIMTKKQADYLEGLFVKANHEYFKLIPFIVRYGISRLLRKPLDFKRFDMSDLMISIDPAQGLFLYQQVLAKKPQTIFEFGLSHGVSAIFLSLALQKLGGGKLYSVEDQQKKVDVAKQHLTHLGLNDDVNILSMDVFDAIDSIQKPIDMVHMDGFPDLNLAVLKKLESKLAPNALIITDDSSLFNLEMREYIDYLMHSDKYATVLLRNSTGILYSVALS